MSARPGPYGGQPVMAVPTVISDPPEDPIFALSRLAGEKCRVARRCGPEGCIHWAATLYEKAGVSSDGPGRAALGEALVARLSRLLLSHPARIFLSSWDRGG